MIRRLTLLYDADCGFCRWAIVWLLRRDRRGAIRPVAIGSAEGARLLADLDPDRRSASIHMIDADGGRLSGGAALPPLLAVVPGLRALGRLAALAPGITDRGYRLVAGHRAWCGRLLSAGARRRADGWLRGHWPGGAAGPSSRAAR